MRNYPLYVVGQQPDGSYETFTLDHAAPGDAIGIAERECAHRGLHFIHCARPRKMPHG